MKFKQNSVILSVILIAVLILGTGCFPTAPPVEGDVPSNGSISIAHGASVTNDATPTLTISATGADYMAFSGNGGTWSDWVAYATAYTSFNMITGVGCTTGEGTKTVYVKFKNDAGESITYNDTIEYDITNPKLSTAVYSDAKSKGSGTVNQGDNIVFTFNDEMEKSTITSSNVSSRLPLSAGSYGTTGLTVSWNAAGTVCTVILGTSPTIVSGTTVNPSSSVTDIAGNADNSSAVTISGFLNVLHSVSITPSTASTTAGGATVNLIAKALDTASGDITTSCTFTWSISSIGTISPTTGSSTVYTPPFTGTGTDIIKVTASYAGVIKEANATINVTSGAPPPPLVDPAKLFVSAQNQNARYISLPAGATVKVYSHTTNDATAAEAAGVKVTITSSDTWFASTGFGNTDYIFFTMTDSSMWTSPMSADGQIPTLPDGTALGSIQAKSKNTVTSSADGNVIGSDKITLYVVGTVTAYSAATPVGSTMAVAPDLAAGDVPTYTRTNANGHESAVSGPDGTIVQITSATYTGALVDGKVDPGDIITITYSGNVTVTVASISFVLGGATITADLTSSALNNAVLTITGGSYDLSAHATVNFNLANKNIVDVGGDNWALEHASGIVWTPGTDF